MAAEMFVVEAALESVGSTDEEAVVVDIVAADIAVAFVGRVSDSAEVDQAEVGVGGRVTGVAAEPVDLYVVEGYASRAVVAAPVEWVGVGGTLTVVVMTAAGKVAEALAEKEVVDGMLGVMGADCIDWEVLVIAAEAVDELVGGCCTELASLSSGLNMSTTAVDAGLTAEKYTDLRARC